MADLNITIVVPDAEVTRVSDAIATKFPKLDGGETDASFLARFLAEQLQTQVLKNEVSASREAIFSNGIGLLDEFNNPIL